MSTVKIFGANATNYVELSVPVLAANTTYKFPATAGTAGQVLSTDGVVGTPTLSWVTSASAPVSSVNGSTGAVVLTTTNVAEGTSLYHTDARVLATPITAPTLTNTAIATSDTVQVALGKVQAQISAREPTIAAGSTAQYVRGDKSLSTFASDIWATILTGLSTSTNAAITAADTILVSFGKLQAQITALSSGKLNKTGGTLTVGTINGVPNPTNPDDVSNKGYVDGLQPLSWATKTSSFSAGAKGRYLVDTTTSTIDVTLPASPVAGDTISFVDYARKFDVNKMVVKRNTGGANANIMGLAEDMDVSIQNFSFDLVYSGNATVGWKIK